MAFYDSLFIVKQSLTDEETGGIIDKMKGLLEKNGAKILKADNWGKRKLAYEVDHDRRGTYVHLQFEASGPCVSNLERQYRLEDSVLKFLTVRVEEEDLTALPSPAVESAHAGIQ